MTVILVTGATGFLGSRVVERLVGEGARVRTTSRGVPTACRVEHLAADLATDPLPPLVAGCDVVIHTAGLAHQFRQAGPMASQFRATNALATRRLAEAAAAASVKCFVLASSVSVYGGGASGLVEETAPTRPRTEYAQSKWEAEQHLLEVCRRCAMRPVVLRLATLYGEGDRGNVARLMRTMDRGRFVWIGRGANRKSLLHVDDAARACLRAARYEPFQLCDAMHVFNVAAQPVTMQEIVERLAAGLNCKIPGMHLPAWPLRVALSAAARWPILTDRAARWQQTLAKWLDDDAYCGRRFARAYDFQPRVDLASGIARQVEAYRHPPPAPASRLAA